MSNASIIKNNKYLQTIIKWNGPKLSVKARFIKIDDTIDFYHRHKLLYNKVSVAKYYFSTRKGNRNLDHKTSGGAKTWRAPTQLDRTHGQAARPARAGAKWRTGWATSNGARPPHGGVWWMRSCLEKLKESKAANEDYDSLWEFEDGEELINDPKFAAVEIFLSNAEIADNII